MEGWNSVISILPEFQANSVASISFLSFLVFCSRNFIRL